MNLSYPISYLNDKTIELLKSPYRSTFTRCPFRIYAECLVHVSRPTVEAKTALYTVAQRKAEETRVQIRKQHQASLKRGKYDKHSVELEEVSSYRHAFTPFLL